MFQHASRPRARVNGRVILTVGTSFSTITLVLMIFTNHDLCGMPNSQTVSSTTYHTAPSQGTWISMVQTDQSRYLPSDSVRFTITFSSIPEDAYLKIAYHHLNNILDEHTFTLSAADSFAWAWSAPSEDFRGYLVEIGLLSDAAELDRTTIAVDVSSSWKKFPRYGFVSKYPAMDAGEIEAVISRLNRYHINGLQFYDWHHKHHMPLKGTPENPASTWNDIANRINHFATVAGYIEAAHRRNMKTMAYNLLYGAWSNADADGVAPTWRLFTDQAHQNPWVLDFPDEWAADIYIMDPSNQQWKDYIISNMDSVFLALPFDGWHVDQLGNWGVMYNYQGQEVHVHEAFEFFLKEAKSYLNVNLVMNAVNQYGQSDIAKGPVDFLYTEVWGGNESYADLARIITNNLAFSGDSLNTVLAAYVNYAQSESPGVFNTPGVLLTDAVIFAAGGAHIELGEHMLGHEYFPNNNLAMSEELVQSLISYYDFLVAYENVLRDSVAISSVQLNSTGTVSLKTWPQLGTVWTFSKERCHRQIFHLINFVDAATLNWRDNNGTQPTPQILENITLQFSTDKQVRSIWTASPDTLGSLPVALPFTQVNEQVSFSLPFLKYWDIVVAEYEEGTNSTRGAEDNSPAGFLLGQNYPNPFNPVTAIPYMVEHAGVTDVRIYDVQGRTVYGSSVFSTPGYNRLVFDGSHLSSGTYFYRLKTEHLTATRKMLLLK